MLDRDERGELVRRTAGGLSEPRIVSARDQIGPALLDVLKPVLRSSGADVRTGCRVVSVNPGDGVGVEFVSSDGVRHCVRAKAVVVVQRRNERPPRGSARRAHHQPAERQRRALRSAA